jgi:hypothetical protein
MLATVFLIVALILFILAAVNIASPYQGRLVPLGLAFVVAAWLVPMVT